MTPEPTVAQELEDRKADRDRIAAMLKMSPNEDVESDTLRAVTPHYQQRISECRRQLGMVIQNRPRSAQDSSGRVRKQDGAYRWLPDGEPLGRDSGAIVAAGWSTKHGRPFEQPFELKG